MKKLIVCCFMLVVLSMPAYADFTVTTIADLSAWPDSPQVKCTVNPGTDTTPANGQPYSPEQNWGGGALQQLGQVFMVPSSYIGTPTLDKVAVKLSGTAGTLSVKLYDLWPGDFNDNFHGWGNGNQGTLSPVNLTTNATLLINDTWAYPGSATAKVYLLDFTGSQEVALAYAEKYMFVLDHDNTFQVSWYRNGLYSYTDGDVYRDTGAGTTMQYVNGAGREAGMAVYIPEPATIALLGLGLALLRKRS